MGILNYLNKATSIKFGRGAASIIKGKGDKDFLPTLKRSEKLVAHNAWQLGEVQEFEIRQLGLRTKDEQ